MTSSLFASCFLDGMILAGTASIFGFGIGLCINLLKDFGGIR